MFHAQSLHWLIEYLQLCQGGLISWTAIRIPTLLCHLIEYWSLGRVGAGGGGYWATGSKWWVVVGGGIWLGAGEGGVSIFSWTKRCIIIHHITQIKKWLIDMLVDIMPPGRYFGLYSAIFLCGCYFWKPQLPPWVEKWWCSFLSHDGLHYKTPWNSPVYYYLRPPSVPFRLFHRPNSHSHS